MLAIRLQRTGRSGYAQYRVIVQESRKSPTSGKVVKHLGHFNPHTKEVVINKELAEFYLKNGAQPSNRVVRLLESEGVVLPAWVKKDAPKERTIKNPEKLRVNRPKEETPKAEEQAKEPAAEVATETPAKEPASSEATDAEAEK